MSYYDNWNDGVYRYSYDKKEEEPEQKPPKKKKGFFGKVVVAALIFGIVAGSTTYGTYRLAGTVFGTPEARDTTSEKTTTQSGNTISGTAVSKAITINDVSDIAKNVMPAIVQVTNTSVESYWGFFGQFYQKPSTSAGSGIIVAEDDNYIYIGTNNHVVSNSREITITFINNEALAAELQGTYPEKDLAVVKVPKSEISEDALDEIKVATLGNSANLNVGQATVAIGNALGFGQSVTTGVISALDREVNIQDDTTGQVISNKLIQTDAAINGGNSGGALLNMNGEVIGIVSAKYKATGVEGMGYAIPITEAKVIIDQIMATGEYVEDEDGIPQASVPAGNGAYLGIYGGMDIDQQTSARYDMPMGVYVSQVVSGSPAEEAGIRKGDVIRGVNGQSVSSMTALQSVLASYKPGDKVTVTVAVAGLNYEDRDLKVTLGARES